MSLGDGIALGSAAFAMAAIVFTVFWQNIRIAQIKLDAAKNGLKVEEE